MVVGEKKLSQEYERREHKLSLVYNYHKRELCRVAENLLLQNYHPHYEFTTKHTQNTTQTTYLIHNPTN